jgi:uncharacterized Zn-finger protein
LFLVKIIKKKGYKPFQCRTCQRRFSEATVMTAHVRTHTGERPFGCDQCEKKFAVATALTIHRRLHSGEKPYPCRHKSCSKTFSESSNLTKHVSEVILTSLLIYLNAFIRCVSIQAKSLLNVPSRPATRRFQEQIYFLDIQKCITIIKQNNDMIYLF